MTGPAQGRDGPKAIVLRVVFVLVAVVSIGFLSWTAMLRLAILRRTRSDWALFWGVSVLTVVCVGMLEERFKDSWVSDTGMIVLLVQAAAVVVHFLMADIRFHRNQGRARSQDPVWAPGLYVPPPARTGQSIELRRAELDELSDYLRKDGSGR
ncbi:hypothetical protein [Streptomyces beijiangensis]|uniref:Uncharacterized protein n=1 Tax=Streptomyces beijiangensis TaxID=163361 RepID=A0A939JI61_9ACTN|nr:hypothetical protein [Streptomyces beijiangensis]MBO0512840.1 hypothetical protein [Streptomyces beijiangensis]